MSTLDRLRTLARRAVGAEDRTVPPRTTATSSTATPTAPTPTSAPAGTDWQSSFTEHSAELTAADRAAIARYDELVRTASPERLEEVHREAFARLSPLQRREVQARMRADGTVAESPRTADPADLAASAVRLGSGGLLTAVAGGAVVSAVGTALLQSGHERPPALGPGPGADQDVLGGLLGLGLWGAMLDDVVLDDVWGP